MSRCWACGGPVERRHHPTGKDEEGAYLDPRFIGPFCHDDHEFVHDGWRAQGIECLRMALTIFDSVELRLRRTASTFARANKPHFDVDPTEIAETFLTWADQLRSAIRHQEVALPGWRHDPGFYWGRPHRRGSLPT